MNLNYLIVFIVILLTSTEALVDTWSQTSTDGLTMCNYTYTYRKDRDFDGKEETISDAFECGDGSTTCTTTLKFNKTFIIEYKGDDDLDQRNFENFRGRVGQLASNAGISYTDSRLKEGTFSCTINPGFRVQIVTKPRYHRLTGNLVETCLTDCYDCIISVRSVPLKIEIPVKSNNDNQIAGTISCKAEPAANIDRMIRICNPAKMTSGKMFDAVGDVLHRAMVNTAANRVKTLEHTNIDGNNVWSIGMCWNGLQRDACKACLRYLIDNIWSECDNSKGGQLWVIDCGIRYEFHKLTTANYDDSFLEQS